MKKYYAWSVYLSIGVIVVACSAQAAVEAEPQITGRGPHHRIWQKFSSEGVPVGSYVELASGLHYWDGGQWAESREEIEIVDGGALAQRGPHKVGFAANANTLGAIDFVGADNTRLRSHVLGLAYTDLATGNSVLIAQIKDSIGELHRPNRVIYPDAFTDIKADLRYTYRRGSFEQDVILRQDPPSPAVYGLNPETTRLEVFTEFLDPPAPGRTVASRSQPTAVARLGIQLPEVIDETLDFGEMKVGPGYAFSLADGPADMRFPVMKTWELRDNRHFLIEAIEYQIIKGAIDQLPQAAAPAQERMANRIGVSNRRGEFARVFPKAPPEKRAQKERMLMAAVSQPSAGFVLDYTILPNNIANFTFRGDTTYYLNAGCTLSGTITFEGGTIIKVTNTTTTAFITLQGVVTCRTSPYRPAIITSMNDDTVGERIAGSSGTPSGHHGLLTLFLWTSANHYDLRHIRFLYQRYAIYGNSTVKADISHCEFIKCNQPFFNDKSFWNIRNVLVQDAVNVFHGLSSHTNNVEHLTARGVSNLVASGLPSIKLTNSLLISVTNGVSYSGANVETNLSATGIFETVGSGYHYLNTNSPYRDVGTTNIDSTLWADLKKRTTYPPVVLSNKITSDTTLSMEVQRDTDTPDLGYHYAPIDFAFDTLTVTNATLTVQQGTALAMYGTTGIWLQDNSQLIAEGSPTNRVHFLRYANVQEQPVFWGGTNIGASVLIDPDHYGNAPPTLRLNFANADVLANGGYTTYVDTTNRGLAVFSARNSEFGGGNLFLKDATNATYAITNSVLEQLTLTIDSLSTYFQYNTTLRNVSGVLNGTNAWTFKDNLLDSCSLINSNASLTHDYNAFYNSTNFYWVHALNANEVVLTSLTNVAGPLGRFYLNTNMGPLLNTGSRNATNAGLYHFTCTTNQVKETNSVVDIGYHYVALDSNWIPLDYDGDGVPDYYEDFNGNGTCDAGELCWTNSDTDGDGVGDGVELLQGRNPLGGTLADTNNILNLRVFTPLK